MTLTDVATGPPVLIAVEWVFTELLLHTKQSDGHVLSLTLISIRMTLFINYTDIWSAIKSLASVLSTTDAHLTVSLLGLLAKIKV
jgi:hypothetical protein